MTTLLIIVRKETPVLSWLLDTFHSYEPFSNASGKYLCQSIHFRSDTIFER